MEGRLEASAGAWVSWSRELAFSRGMPIRVDVITPGTFGPAKGLLEAEDECRSCMRHLVALSLLLTAPMIRPRLNSRLQTRRAQEQYACQTVQRGEIWSRGLRQRNSIILKTAAGEGPALTFSAGKESTDFPVCQRVTSTLVLLFIATLDLLSNSLDQTCAVGLCPE